MTFDIGSAAKVFHEAATVAGKWWKPNRADYVTNEIKVQTINVCTLYLVKTIAFAILLESVPLTLSSVIFNGGAILLRQIALLSLDTSPLDKAAGVFNRFLPDKHKIPKDNVPIPNINGWGIFYLSPWLREKFGSSTATI